MSSIDSDGAYERLMNAALRYVSIRPRSEKELRDFFVKTLHRWHMTAPKVVDTVLDRLKELGYVDDKKFAQWLVQSRRGRKPMGTRLIIQQLKQKGISKEIIQEVIGETRDPVSDEVVDDHALALRAIVKKRQLWQALPPLVQKQKLYGFLLRRGFTGDIVARVVDEVVQNGYNEQV